MTSSADSWSDALNKAQEPRAAVPGHNEQFAGTAAGQREAV